MMSWAHAKLSYQRSDVSMVERPLKQPPQQFNKTTHPNLLPLEGLWKLSSDVLIQHNQP